MMRGNFIVAFHYGFIGPFHQYFLRRHFSNTFLYRRNIKIFISLKRHTFNIKYYLRKSYLYKRFILAYIRVTKLLKKKKKKLFTEELHFAELFTQAEHLRVWILHSN